MEGLIKRTYIFAGLLLLAGVALAFSPRPAREVRTEAWMEDHAPLDFGDYRFLPGPDNPKASYRMNEATYNELVPYGIVARKYTDGRRTFDTVLIASNNKDSFHDPRVCFTGQGWTILQEERIQIPTQTRGTIEATFARMSHAQYGPSIAVFFYRSPARFSATTNSVKWDIFLEELRFGPDIDGVFYRFIPLYANATREELVEFVGEYMDAAAKVSMVTIGGRERPYF